MSVRKKNDGKLRNKQRDECCYVFFWVRTLKKNSHPIRCKTIHVRSPPIPQFNVVLWIMCLAAFKKQSFLFIVFGTSTHNIEVGGYGGNVCIYVVSCGWLFFEVPREGFLFRLLVQHAHRHTERCDNITFWHVYPSSKHALAIPVTTPQRWILRATITIVKQIYVCNMWQPHKDGC